MYLVLDNQTKFNNIKKRQYFLNQQVFPNTSNFPLFRETLSSG